MNSRHLTHIDKEGRAGMVDIGGKSRTQRRAKAEGSVVLNEEIMGHLEGKELITQKGPVFHTAVIAAIMAAKKNHELIPLCHPVALDHCDVHIGVSSCNRIKITATTRTNDKTGVEMEALTAVSVAALTIYDMCKALSHNIEIENIRLLEKSGGKEDFTRNKLRNEPRIEPRREAKIEPGRESERETKIGPRLER